jgi:membrane-associated protease RseP (regulator of RpoE activity)
MISVALAIMNVLPIPALDWWRFWALIIQKVFRIKEEKFSTVEWYVNWFFFWLLMIIWVIIMIKDSLLIPSFS